MAEQSSLLADDVDESVEVAVPVPLRRTFSYRVPSALRSRIALGTRVAVPFSGRKLAGFVIGERGQSPAGTKLKALAAVLDDRPIFPAELFSFLLSAADYYMHPIGEVLRAAAPALATEALSALRDDGFLADGESLPGRHIATRRVLVARATASVADVTRLGSAQQRVLSRIVECGEMFLDELRADAKNPRAILRALVDKGLVTTEEREVPADRFFSTDVVRDVGPTPNAEQAMAIDMLCAKLEAGGGGFLLHGITGSGKTEVYLRVIAQARARGLGALVLVPEIALTPQLVSRFRARFGDEIAVLHSELSERERSDAWKALRDGRVQLAIGARSALFAPVSKLQVVIVDEEHDASFKQEEGFRYHARDMAILRAHRAGAVCVLGSATPSLETHYLAEQGKLTRLSLHARATSQALPPVEIVDLKRHRAGSTGSLYLSEPLLSALRTTLAEKQQAILFLNRRGFSPSVRCETCGELMGCPACSVTLTRHRRADLLRCHYCDFTLSANAPCKCGARTPKELGMGTEQLEDTLAAAFPQANIGRLDRDTAAADGVEQIMDRLRRGEIDILVGTQMVTKGHDVSGVTLVGVILADQSLAFPDFRASERTFQLLTQVAGRAGRGDRAGRVVLQTFQPEHMALVRAQTHDYAGFCRDETLARQELGYPPFSRLVAVRVDAGDEAQARACAQELANIAKQHVHVREGRVALLGPAPAPIERLRGRYRQRFLLRAEDRRALRAVAQLLVRRLDEGIAPARASIDFDPVAML